MYDTQLCNMHQHQGLIVHIYTVHVIGFYLSLMVLSTSWWVPYLGRLRSFLDVVGLDCFAVIKVTIQFQTCTTIILLCSFLAVISTYAQWPIELFYLSTYVCLLLDRDDGSTVPLQTSGSRPLRGQSTTAFPSSSTLMVTISDPPSCFLVSSSISHLILTAKGTKCVGPGL